MTVYDIEWNDGRDGLQTASLGPLTATICYQDFAEDPRHEWDHLWTFHCEHSRYILGDERSLEDAVAAVRSSRTYRDTWEDGSEQHPWDHHWMGELVECFDFSDPNQVYEAMLRCDDILTAPLFLYDHSGLSISTSGFSCPWDSGQVGFAFVTFDKLRQDYGVRRVTAAVRTRALNDLKREVDEYDHYLGGRVCYYSIEDEEGTHLDGCGGYYGWPDESGCQEDAENALRYCLSVRQKARETRLSELIRNNVPLHLRAAELEK